LKQRAKVMAFSKEPQAFQVCANQRIYSCI